MVISNGVKAPPVLLLASILHSTVRHPFGTTKDGEVAWAMPVGLHIFFLQPVEVFVI